jgi:hypothetical protein
MALRQVMLGAERVTTVSTLKRKQFFFATCSAFRQRESLNMD